MTPEQFFAALSHPLRLRVALLLCQVKEICVCELTDIFSVSQPVLSKQLAQLKKAEIVSSTRKGTWIYYRINVQQPEWQIALLEQTTKGLSLSSPFNTDMKHYQSKTQTACC
jgi:ArsR family transcriptional regulator